MRNPKRIPEILEKLREIWEKNPDLRLTQLLVNLQTASNNDLYYVEDEKFIELLNKFYNE